MTFDELKSGWDQAGPGPKKQAELLAMTKLRNHAKIKRTLIRFGIETFLLLAFIVVYQDAFDGGGKPLWANLLLIGSAAVFILVRLIGWLVLRNPVSADNLSASLRLFSKKLSRVAIGHLLTSALFGGAVILFFSSAVVFSPGRYVILAMMIVTLLIVLWIAYRNWANRIGQINRSADGFNAGE